MSELPLYQIVGWNEHFENYKSRSVGKCSFVCVPNKHGGVGLTGLLMSEPDPYGHAFYGVWQLMLQFCSRQKPPREGWLTADGRKDGPRMPAAEWARMFRCSPSLIRRTFRALESVRFIKLLAGQPEVPASQQNTGLDTGSDTASDTKTDTSADTVGISSSDDEGRKERRKEPPTVPKGGLRRMLIRNSVLKN